MGGRSLTVPPNIRSVAPDRTITFDSPLTPELNVQFAPVGTITFSNVRELSVVVQTVFCCALAEPTASTMPAAVIMAGIQENLRIFGILFVGLFDHNDSLVLRSARLLETSALA
jgi:hypothetical protein